VTVAAIIERDDRYLLVEERTSEGLRLNNPAGHLDPGESLVEAVEREVLEETACPFTAQWFLGANLARMIHPRTGEDITFLRFAFAGTAGEAIAGRVLDEPVVRTLWLTYEELQATRHLHRSPYLIVGIDAYRSGVRYPLEMLRCDPSVHALQPPVLPATD